MATTVLRRIALLPIDGRTLTRATRMPGEERPSLFKLWRWYRFSTGVLSIKARVPPGTVNAMLGDKPVARGEAEKVLGALSALLQETFTLQTVAVALSAETEQMNGHACSTEQWGATMLSAGVRLPDALQR